MAAGGLEDDATIADDAVLWRRIHPDRVVLDENLGRQRPSSAEFRDKELSVILADPGREPASVLVNYPDRFLASIKAGEARKHSLRIVRAPTSEEPAHCHILGEKPRRIGAALAEAAVWVVPPPVEKRSFRQHDI